MQLLVWQRQTDGARMKRNQYPKGKLLLRYLCRELTSCVNKPSARASKGVLLLHNSHQFSFMQVNVEFLRGVALALGLVQRLGAVRGQQLGPVLLCLPWGLQLETNQWYSSSVMLGSFPDKNLDKNAACGNWLWVFTHRPRSYLQRDQISSAYAGRTCPTAILTAAPYYNVLCSSLDGKEYSRIALLECVSQVALLLFRISWSSIIFWEANCIESYMKRW